MHEILTMGSFFGGQQHNLEENDQEKWSFYNVFDFSYPSETELQHLKAIIIPGSESTVLDHHKVSWKNALITFI